ncbi:MAG: recombinase family protein [Arachnia sp.]
MAETLIGYALCSTEDHDAASQRDRLCQLGVPEDRVHLDHGLADPRHERPGLDEALSAVIAGDTLVVTKLARLARSAPEARDIVDGLAERGIKLRLGEQLYDPTDPTGRVFFDVVATFAEFDLDVRRMMSKEAMLLEGSRRRLLGRQRKLTVKQRAALRHMYATGDYKLADLAEMFAVSRATVYRALA